MKTLADDKFDDENIKAKIKEISRRVDTILENIRKVDTEMIVEVGKE